jgi:hypothetical protein
VRFAFLIFLLALATNIGRGQAAALVAKFAAAKDCKGKGLPGNHRFAAEMTRERAPTACSKR